jgi:hypothetical protein
MVESELMAGETVALKSEPNPNENAMVLTEVGPSEGLAAGWGRCVGKAGQKDFPLIALRRVTVQTGSISYGRIHRD